MTSPEKFTFPQNSSEKGENTKQQQVETGQETHEVLKFQERTPFDNKVDHLDTHDEIELPTDEERAKMDHDLKEFNTIFAESDIDYYIDGGLIVSMMRGEYMRTHKDIDISVARDDLEKLDKLLLSKNYGLFRVYPKNPNDPRSVNVFERMSGEDLHSGEEEFLMIASINEQGKINDDTRLNFMDVHVIETKKTQKGFSGVELPQEWFRPRDVIFRGQKFKIAHPAILAYIKLHRKRPYDQTDLHNLAETDELSSVDIDAIERAIEQEFENNTTAVSNIIKRVAPNITQDSTAEDVFDALMQDKDVADRIKKEEDKERVHKLAELITRQDDKSSENIIRVVIDAAGVEAEVSEQREKLSTLRQRVSNVEKIKEIKDNLEK
jgi:hypothetical protein